MPNGKTLWEMLLAKIEGPVESHFYNPLKAKVGSPVMINEIELKDDNFTIKEIRQYQRTIGSKDFYFVDYVLLAHQLEAEDILARLRLNPIDDPDSAGGLTHQALLLRLYDDLPYNEELHKVVNDTTKKFQVTANGQVVEEYWRINDVTSSYKAKVAVVKDANQNGKAAKDEIEKMEVEYWDYWREVKDQAGQTSTQFLFVEMDTDNGWFQLWQGQEIDPQRVFVL